MQLRLFVLSMGLVAVAAQAMDDGAGKRKFDGAQEGNVAKKAKVDPVQMPALFKAIQDNDYQAVQQLCAGDNVAEIINQEWDGKSPLAQAFCKGYNGGNENQHIIKCLIEHGADVNIKYFFDAFDVTCWTTLLHMATQAMWVDIVKLLIQKGHALDAMNSEGHTPLFETGKFARAYSEALKNVCYYLIDQGASLPKTDKWLDSHKYIDSRCQFAYRAIKYALEHDNMAELSALLAYYNQSDAITQGINVQDDTTGDTLLHIIARLENGFEKNKKAWLLLARGANPNVCNTEGLTPLHIALQQQDIKLFGLLVAYGADITVNVPQTVIQTKEGEEVNSFKLAANRPQFMSLLMRAAFAGPLGAIQNNDWATLYRYVLAHDVNKLNKQDADGNTLLHHVAYVTEHNHTPEITNMRRYMAKLLRISGSNVNAQNNAGLTPLHVAVNTDAISVVEELLELKADIRLKDNDGFSAFDYACNKKGQALWHLAGIGALCADDMSEDGVILTSLRRMALLFNYKL